MKLWLKTFKTFLFPILLISKFCDGWGNLQASVLIKKERNQPANIDPQDNMMTSISKVPRTSPKNSNWPSGGCLDLISQRRTQSTFQGRPLKDVLMASLECLQWMSHGRRRVFCWMFLNFIIFFEFWIDLICLNSIGVFRTQSNIYNGAFLRTSNR